jgi:hypothetical protein|tara:strand:+ start:94 stop:294 length:201 start_codon:yes stop_codon:yes gene_type:complete
MRKIIDAISIASFAISLTMAIGGGYIYMKRVDFMNQMMLTLQDQMVDIIQNQIKMPNVTGPALPFK